MPYSPLPVRRLPERASIELAGRAAAPQVGLESPALLVMDSADDMLAATIAPHEQLAQAEQRMVQQGVRSLFVVAAMPRLLGILTLADLQGERPLRLVSQRRVAHRDLRVADLMQPVALLETIEYAALRRATVGRLVATLLASGHPQLLVVEPGRDDATCQLRGIVSQSRVERQLGTRFHAIPVAETFAEIEQALI